ncbi:MAG: hypothetical protein ACE5DM_04565 [Candidatus Nanoarchaeia archaeon]
MNEDYGNWLFSRCQQRDKLGLSRDTPMDPIAGHLTSKDFDEVNIYMKRVEGSKHVRRLREYDQHGYVATTIEETTLHVALEPKEGKVIHVDFKNRVRL